MQKMLQYYEKKTNKQTGKKKKETKNWPKTIKYRPVLL